MRSILSNAPHLRLSSLLLPVLLAALALGTVGCAPLLQPVPAPAPEPAPDDVGLREIEGTVRHVDARSNAIELSDARARSRLDGATDRVTERLYWVEGTEVEYQGRVYRPEDLEVGDEISALAEVRSGRLVTDRIEVLYDSTSDGAPPAATADLRGTVEWVDLQGRLLTIRADPRYRTGFVPGEGADEVRLSFDSTTTVVFRGRTYDPSHLERGDVVEIETRRVGSRLHADEIVVVRDVRSGR